MYSEQYYYQDAAVPLSVWLHRAYWQFRDHIATSSPTGPLLEIGCNNGFLLAVARQHGFTVRGVEISETASRVARELYDMPIFIGTVEQFADVYSGPRFATIYASAVLEHTLDPLSFLRACRNLITPDGMIILMMPNWDAWLRKLRPRSWGGYQAYHLYYFNLRALSLCLDRCAFHITEAWNLHDEGLIDIYRAMRWLKPIYRLFSGPKSRSTHTQQFSRNAVDRLMHEVFASSRFSKLEKLQAILNWPMLKAMGSHLGGNAFGVRAAPV
jgi:SAM-dependent methyltransferase